MPALGTDRDPVPKRHETLPHCVSDREGYGFTHLYGLMSWIVSGESWLPLQPQELDPHAAKEDGDPRQGVGIPLGFGKRQSFDPR